MANQNNNIRNKVQSHVSMKIPNKISQRFNLKTIEKGDIEC